MHSVMTDAIRRWRIGPQAGAPLPQLKQAQPCQLLQLDAECMHSIIHRLSAVSRFHLLVALCGTPADGGAHTSVALLRQLLLPGQLRLELVAGVASSPRPQARVAATVTHLVISCPGVSLMRACQQLVEQVAWPRLQRLQLEGCSRVTAEEADMVDRCLPSITALDLSLAYAGDADVQPSVEVLLRSSLGRRLQTLSLRNSHAGAKLWDSRLSALCARGATRLRRLRLSSLGYAAGASPALDVAALSQLTCLDLSCHALPDQAGAGGVAAAQPLSAALEADLRPLQRLTALRRLQLHTESPCQPNWAFLAALPALTQLHANQMQLTAGCSLPGLQQLRHLVCWRLSPDGLAHLAGCCPGLTALTYAESAEDRDKAAGAGRAAAALLPHLQHLQWTLPGGGEAFRGVRLAQACPALTRLHARDAWGSAAVSLAGLTRLADLADGSVEYAARADWRGCRVACTAREEADWRVLAQLPGLRCCVVPGLGLGGDAAAAACAAACARLTALEVMRLAAWPQRQLLQWVSALQHMRQLKLHNGGNMLPDAAAAALARLPCLQELHVTTCTTQQLGALAASASLERLHIMGGIAAPRVAALLNPGHWQQALAAVRQRHGRLHITGAV